jgi:GNAT superfamily N-acetyltransferase
VGAVDGAAGWQGEVRQAKAGDADDIARLAAGLAIACCWPCAGTRASGYLLGFRHLTFYANGPVGWVEEVVVRDQDRGRGIGRVLMDAFEQWAAAEACTLIALATRRAAPFYRALGYEESAAYFRKVLIDPPAGRTAGGLPPSPPPT